MVSAFSRKLSLAAIFMTVSISAAFSQEVTRSDQVPGLRTYDIDLKVMPRAEKDSVRMVADIWQEYVASFTSAMFTSDRRRSMWVDGSPDYLLEYDDGNLLYASFRETRIADIRKINAGTYEIILITRSKIPGEEFKDWVESVYKVCAMAVVKPSGKKNVSENPFRLCNWLDAVIPTLKKSSGKDIGYYCSPGCSVPSKAARANASFVRKFKAEYGIEYDQPLRYVVAPSVELCESYSGFQFNAYSNPLTGSLSPKISGSGFYGGTFGAGTILSDFYDDRYDMLLLLVRSEYPDAQEMIQKGLAAYYGGYMDYTFKELKHSLENYLEKNKVDLLDEDAVCDIQVPLISSGSRNSQVSVPLLNILGGVLAENAVTENGVWKVKELLECTDYQKLFPTLGIASKNVNSFVRESLKQDQ